MRVCLSGGLTFISPHSSITITPVIARSEATKQSRLFPWDFLDCFASLAMTAHTLMIIPCHADAAGDVVITGCELHAGAGGLLADSRAIEFLPRRLVGRIGEAAARLEFGAPPLQLFL